MDSTLYSISSCCLLALDLNYQILVANHVMSTYNNVICDDVVLCVSSYKILLCSYCFQQESLNNY